MDELKLKKDNDSNDQGVKKSFISLPELVIATAILIPLYMLLVYLGLASYTPKSALSFLAGSIIGWVFAWLMIRKGMI